MERVDDPGMLAINSNSELAGGSYDTHDTALLPSTCIIVGEGGELHVLAVCNCRH